MRMQQLAHYNQRVAQWTEKYQYRPYCLPYHKAREYAIREAGKSRAQSTPAQGLYR